MAEAWCCHACATRDRQSEKDAKEGMKQHGIYYAVSRLDERGPDG